MKKITLIMLVAMVPFLTMAQKRAKNKKDKETTENNIASYEFMVITGYEMAVSADLAASDNARNAVVKIVFDMGGIKDSQDFSEMQYRTMAHAVNEVGKTGWRFVNANVVNVEELKVHYYYMKREKKR